MDAVDMIVATFIVTFFGFTAGWLCRGWYEAGQ